MNNPAGSKPHFLKSGCYIFNLRDLQRQACAKHFDKIKNKTKMIEDYCLIRIMCGKKTTLLEDVTLLEGRAGWPVTQYCTVQPQPIL